jgi:pimeloyl-ACP methyl ester carboxylesterase
MVDPALSYVAYEEYLAAEQKSDTKHEWLDGVVYAMEGGTLEHVWARDRTTDRSARAARRRSLWSADPRGWRRRPSCPGQTRPGLPRVMESPRGGSRGLNVQHMKHIILSCIIVLPWILGSCAQTQHKPVATNACSQSVLNVGGNKIWVNKEGAGNVTVAFEAGFGNDSSVWAEITPKIRAAGAQTFVYDRAGMGKSTIDTSAPYSIDNDVHILRTALTSCGIDGPILMVGHSYGGGMSLVAASQDERIRGIVLLDAVVPKASGNGELEKNLATMRAQYDEIRAKAPELAKVAIPWAEALPVTVKRIDDVRILSSLPIIDIVAEHGQNSAASTQVWRDAHIEFTANNPSREYIVATGSSHKVMVDKPALVIETILRMLDKIKGARKP